MLEEGNNFIGESVGLCCRLAQLSGREDAVEPSPSEGPSYLGGHRSGDFGLTPVKNIGGLEKQIAAHGEWCSASLWKRGARGVNRSRYVVASGARESRNGFAREWVAFFEDTVAQRSLPFAADEQLPILNRCWVHEISFYILG